MYRVVDKVVSNGRGDGLDENGEQVFLDSTQAVPRRPYSLLLWGPTDDSPELQDHQHGHARDSAPSKACAAPGHFAHI